MTRSFPGLLALLCFISGIASAAPVVRAIDGDTLMVGGVTIDLYGIDAPEMDQHCTWGKKSIPCGVLARDALLDLITGVSVACDPPVRSAEGRNVATCTGDGFDIGQNMVHTGWSLADRKQTAKYGAIEDKARQARRGLWRGSFTPPWRWRAQHQK